MKAAIIAGTVALLLGGLLWCMRPLNTIEYHRRGWFAAVEELQGGTRGPSILGLLRRKISHWRRGERDAGQVMREHEGALIRLGYLAQRDFHLTNQVITRAFSSNFFGRVRQTFGTNESIWMYHSFTNKAGLHVTVPARDMARWEVLFRECAASCASNVPSASPP